jgi:hypothetical protein
MQLEFAICATSAEVFPNGTFYALGAGFDFIEAASFPATHHAMTLLIRLRVAPQECGREHELRARITQPSGGLIPHEVTLAFTPTRHLIHPEQDSSMTFALNYFGLTFPEAGNYAFNLTVDGVQIGQTVVEAVVKRQD